MNIGFIGIGQMGNHMCRHVLDAGYKVMIYDLNKGAAQDLLKKGATWMDTPRSIAESCDVVLTSLPGPPEVEEVVYGATGLMTGWKKGDIYVDMSTNSPTTIRRVAADAKTKGVVVLDAPVSGGPSGAEAGTLSIIVGGDAKALEKVHKILEAMGSKIFHVGEVGCGNIAKLVNNMISSTCNAITAEGLVLGVKAGMDVGKLHEVLKGSTANSCWIERNYPKTVFQGNFEPGFRIALVCKDINLALEMAREYGVPMPVGVNVEQRFLETKAAGLGDKGAESIILHLEELAGVKVRLPE